MLPHARTLLFCLLAVLASEVQGASETHQALDLVDLVGQKDLHGICFLADDKHGWMVGEKGLCLKTSDGGHTWRALKTQSRANLRDVWFKDEKNGWACGDGDPEGPSPRGHILGGNSMVSSSLLVTTDGGATWKGHWVPTNFQLPAVDASQAPILRLGNAGDAFHLDGDNLVSNNHGKKWNARRVYRALFDLHSFDKQNIIAIGSGVVVGFMPTPKSPLFTNQNSCAIYSTDGGRSWKISKGSDRQGARDHCLRKLAIHAKAPLLAVGDQGVVLSSSDQGATWKRLKTGIKEDLQSVSYGRDPKEILAVGRTGRAVFSMDGGQSWQSCLLQAKLSLLDVSACGQNFIVIGAKGKALRVSLKGLSQAAATQKKDEKTESGKPLIKTARMTKLAKGDWITYQVDIKSQWAMVTGCFQRKDHISSLTADGITVQTEVSGGNPPRGMPKHKTEERPFKQWTDYATWKVGQSETKEGRLYEDLIERMKDETLTVGKQTFECLVIRTKRTITGLGNAVTETRWYAKEIKVPINGLVKSYRKQMVNMMGRKMTIEQTAIIKDFGKAM